MILTGHVHNGVVVPDQPSELPEDASVLIELLPAANTGKSRSSRVGGIWKGGCGSHMILINCRMISRKHLESEDDDPDIRQYDLPMIAA